MRFLVCIIPFIYWSTVCAQELSNDTYTLLLLHFNNSTTGADGETPSTSTGISFTTGIHNQGVLIADGDLLKYATTDNIDPSAGTIEFWMQPHGMAILLPAISLFRLMENWL